MTELNLAYGEVTGSFHKLISDNIELLEDTRSYKLFKLSSPGYLFHSDSKGIYESHRPIKLGRTAVSSIQVEYDPFRKIIRRVID